MHHDNYTVPAATGDHAEELATSPPLRPEEATLEECKTVLYAFMKRITDIESENVVSATAILEVFERIFPHADVEVAVRRFHTLATARNRGNSSIRGEKSGLMGGATLLICGKSCRLFWVRAGQAGTESTGSREEMVEGNRSILSGQFVREYTDSQSLFMFFHSSFRCSSLLRAASMEVGAFSRSCSSSHLSPATEPRISLIRPSMRLAMTSPTSPGDPPSVIRRKSRKFIDTKLNPRSRDLTRHLAASCSTATDESNCVAIKLCATSFWSARPIRSA